MENYAFEPHPWLRSGMLQTYFSQLVGRTKPHTASHNLSVMFEGGDQTILHIDIAPTKKVTQPTMVLLMHGLGGSCESVYMLRIARKLNSIGIDAARYNHRGCGPGASRLAKQIYHAGRSDDLHTTLLAMAKHFPQHRLLVCGFSLSGNILLRYLGQCGLGDPKFLDAPNLHATMAVCPPVELELCSRAVDQRRNRIIDRHFSRRLAAEARERRHAFPDLQHPQLPTRFSLREFDELFTAKMGGFLDRRDYYESCSSARVAHAIQIPTTLIAAADDPVIPSESITKTPFSSHVKVLLQQSGGHMGFIAAKTTRFGDRLWMDEAVVNWAENC